MHYSTCVRICCLAALGLTHALGVLGQEDAATLEDLLETGEQWVQENIDPEVLDALSEVDQERVTQFFDNLRQRFEGEYVADLAALKGVAAAVLPMLESQPDVQPYAAWLKARLDYLDVADGFDSALPAAKEEPGQPIRPRANPAPDAERKAWQRQLERRPMPAGAKVHVGRLKEVFAAQKVPGELVWLAEVESGFEPRARSPAGAAGLFQLMPRTAQALGLSLRRGDDRLHPEKSAAAAAKYLKYLHGRFKDWPLALAAYNAGEGRVRNLLGRHKAQSFDAISKHLPAETQMYVPRVEATLLRREGLTLAQLPAPST